MISEDFQSIFTAAPTYLQQLLLNNEYIYLVYKNLKQEDASENDIHQICKADPIHLTDNSVNLDLTGCPLETDLKGNLSSLSTIIYNIPDNWTSEEGKHEPLSVKQARCVINNHNRRKTKGVSGDCKNAPIYVICDGKDNEKTILLGSLCTNAEFTRMIVFAKGLLPTTDPYMQLQKMKEEHLEDIDILNPKIESVINCVYSLYGHNLKKSDDPDKLQKPGSISMQLSWNTFSYDIPELKSSVNMLLQVVIGHQDSRMYCLWEQLLLLKNYIYILNSCKAIDLEELVISSTSCCVYEIMDQISVILAEYRSWKMIPRNSVKSNIDVNKLREENSLDRLYILFTNCKTIGDLTKCFATVFNEVAQNVSLKLYIPEENNTKIANIIRNIYKGIEAIPTLTPKQALQFHIELGFEKLRQDYFSILNYFKCAAPQDLLNYWQEFAASTTQEQQQINRMSKNVTRKSRMTMHPSQIFISSDESANKLAALGRMHVITEFLFMMKENEKFSDEETFQHVTENAVAKFLENSTIKDFSEIQQNRIFNLEVPLPANGTNMKALEKKLLSSWRLCMTSTVKKTTYQTVYLHTRYPIFPPLIYSDYDMKLDLEGDLYYVTKMCQYSDQFN